MGRRNPKTRRIVTSTHVRERLWKPFTLEPQALYSGAAEPISWSLIVKDVCERRTEADACPGLVQLVFASRALRNVYEGHCPTPSSPAFTCQPPPLKDVAHEHRKKFYAVTTFSMNLYTKLRRQVEDPD